MNGLEIGIIAVCALTLIAVVGLLIVVLRKAPHGGAGVDIAPIIEDALRSNNLAIADIIRLNNGNTIDTVERMQRDILSRFDKLVELTQAGYINIDRQVQDQFKTVRHELAATLQGTRDELNKTLQNMRNDEELRAKNMRDLIDRRVNDMHAEVKENLAALRGDNERRLNEIKEVVDEKLQTTLDTRISESFKVINAQLESVNKGLGEMTNLSGSVDNLNRVLNGVKQRGVWGEVMLENLLEQILTDRQYGSQVQISGDNRVDFAVVMPGRDADKLLLPIDAKFPLADYEKYIDACDSSIKEDIIAARRGLVKAITEQAKSISAKYISIPKTTNFAIMYLPIEGLYAELVRDPELMDSLHVKYNVLLCGPTTLTALLTSLQMGFKTLAIQERSSEVWKTLSSFKKDFQKFAGLLDKTRKKAGEIVGTIDDGIERGRLIGKRLDKLTADDEIGCLIDSEVGGEQGQDGGAAEVDND